MAAVDARQTLVLGLAMVFIRYGRLAEAEACIEAATSEEVIFPFYCYREKYDEPYLPEHTGMFKKDRAPLEQSYGMRFLETECGDAAASIAWDSKDKSGHGQSPVNDLQIPTPDGGGDS